MTEEASKQCRLTMSYDGTLGITAPRWQGEYFCEAAECENPGCPMDRDNSVPVEQWHLDRYYEVVWFQMPEDEKMRRIEEVLRRGRSWTNA